MTQVLINKRKDLKILQDAILVCLGGKLRYTSIPNLEGIPAFKIAFGKYSQKMVAAKVFLTFLALILTLKLHLPF